MIVVVCLCSCGVTQSPIERQMIGLTQKFDLWDENGDGKLSANELDEAVKASGFTAAEIIEFYDSDGDGLISLRETQEGISRSNEVQTMGELQSTGR